MRLFNLSLDECDAIAPHLPISYKELIKSETGRATRGAAMALKSRAYYIQQVHCSISPAI